MFGFVVSAVISILPPSLQVHLFDIDIPGKQSFKESDVLSPGNNLLSYDTGKDYNRGLS